MLILIDYTHRHLKELSKQLTFLKLVSSSSICLIRSCKKPT